MSKRLFILILIFLSPLLSAKPYQKALVLSAGGFSYTAYAAILESLKANGWEPDVIISNCGATLASAISLSFNNPQDNVNYLFSKEHHQSMRSVKLAEHNALKLHKHIKKESPERIPDLFKLFVVDLKQDLSFPGAIESFPINGTRLVITGAEMLFDEKDAGLPRDRAILKETYFTDPYTAKYLRDFKSPLAKMFPKSGYDKNVNVVTSVAPFIAARASVTDPYLMQPAQINGRQFLSSDAYPIELAHHLAEQVVSVYPVVHDTYLMDIFHKAYGFDYYERLKKIVQRKDTQWIDVYGVDSSLRPKRGFLFFLTRGVPASYKKFFNTLKEQWEFGWKRGAEAAKALKNQNPIKLRRSVQEQIQDQTKTQP